jgi:hypothetical protein
VLGLLGIVDPRVLFELLKENLDFRFHLTLTPAQ